MGFRHHALRLLLLSSTLAGISAQADEPATLVAAAKSQIGITLQYDPRYERLAYPNGDVPIERGVCTDVVVRAYRKLDLDLQALVHEDMRRAWHAYPKIYGLKRPDRNIDHRRVPNLQTFFQRHGKSLTPGSDPRAYLPGDVVTWRLPRNLTHIGIVSDQRSARGVPLIIHNIGSGAKLEDMLFAFEVTGHYRWPAPASTAPGVSAARAPSPPSDSRSGSRH